MMATLPSGCAEAKHHHAFAELLLEVVDQRAELAALERIGAVGQDFHAFNIGGAADCFIEAAGGGLHAGFFEFAAEALQFVFLRGEFGAEAFGEVVDRGNVLTGQLGDFEVAAEGVERTESADGLDAANAGGDGAFAGQLEQADFAGGGRCACRRRVRLRSRQRV